MKHLSGFPYLFLLSLTTGALLCLSFFGIPFLAFVALIPLLEMDHQLKKGGRETVYFASLTYLAFLPANFLLPLYGYQLPLSDTWPLLLTNPLFMATVLVLFRITKRNISLPHGYFALILYWLSLEYLNLNLDWPLSWPGLTLGLVFSSQPSFVQWYAYTGVLGGSLWILVITIFIFLTLRSSLTVSRRVYGLYTVLVFLIVWLFSIYCGYHIPEAEEVSRVLVPDANWIESPTPISHPDTFSLVVLPPAMSSFKKHENTIRASSSAFYYPTIHWQVAARDYSETMFISPVQVGERPHIGSFFREEAPQFHFLKPPVYSSVFAGQFSKASSNSPTDSPLPIFRFADKPGVAVLGENTLLFGDRLRPFILENAYFFIVYPLGKGERTLWAASGIRNRARLRAIESRRQILCFVDAQRVVLIREDGNTQSLVGEGTQEQPIHLRVEETFYMRYGDYLGRLAWFLAVALFLSGLIKRKTHKN